MSLQEWVMQAALLMIACAATAYGTTRAHQNFYAQREDAARHEIAVLKHDVEQMKGELAAERAARATERDTERTEREALKAQIATLMVVINTVPKAMPAP